MERQHRAGVPRRREINLLSLLPYIYLALTIGAVLYYILGAGAAEVHSDSTDNLLWAEASLQAKRSLDPGFKYAGYLPFGSGFWAVPLLAVFGYGWTAYKLTNLIFFLFFVVAAWLGFRSFALSYSRTAYALGSFLMLCSASAKMREIFWGHVIYYSVAVLFLLLALHFMKQRRFILLAILSVGSAINGLQGIAMFHLPLIGAILAQTLIDRLRLRFYSLNILALSIPVGFGLKLILERGGVSAGYASAYMTYSDEGKWLGNLGKFPRHIRYLFDATVEANASMASIESLAFVMRLFLVLILLAIPIYLLIRWRFAETALPLYTYTFLTALILFTMVFGKLGSSSWRLIPALILGAFVSLGYLAEKTKVNFNVETFLALFLALFTLVQAGQIYAMPFDGWQENKLAPVQEMLLEMGAEDTPVYGDFWISHVLRLSSDDRLETRAITVNSGEIRPYYYQVQATNYLETAAKDDFYLVLRSFELSKVEKDLEKLDASILERRQVDGYHIFVGEGNLWKLLDYDIERHFTK